jgi:hypothetical protein
LKTGEADAVGVESLGGGVNLRHVSSVEVNLKGGGVYVKALYGHVTDQSVPATELLHDSHHLENTN